MNFVKNILIAVNFTVIFANPSGIYVDNGRGQTVSKQFASMKEKYQFERNLLNMFGLSRKPKRLYNSTNLSDSASKYLIEVYDVINSNEIENLFYLERNYIQQSDAILTFPSQVYKVVDGRHKKRRKLCFNLTSNTLTETHSVFKAELRLYKQLEGLNKENDYMIKIHLININFDSEQRLKLIDVFNVTSNYQGWIRFNITSALLLWITNPTNNHGLSLSVYKLSNNFKQGKKIHPESIGLVTSTSDLEFEPFVVAFLKLNATKPLIRRKREIRLEKKKVLIDSNPFIPESDSSWKKCQLQTLYVDFKDLRWDNWIIAPNGYAAYYCYGECTFPEMNATNHAIIQSLMHLMSKNEVPAACCAPKRYSSMTAIYYLDDRSVLLKSFSNMIIESCECQ